MRNIYYIFISLIVSVSCGNQKPEWYRIEKIDDNTYIISEPNSSQGNSCFLIMGNKEGILFDSGTGESKTPKITQVIESLTKLPVTLLLSHFHFDHIGNLSDFTRIGIPEIESLQQRLSADSLIHLTQSETLIKDPVSLKISRQFPLGKEIDLGNRKLKILHTPGHSKESISIIDTENAYIFTGDLVYNGLLLLNDCNACIKSLDKILGNSQPTYRVFGSHGKPEVNYQRLGLTKKALEYYLADSIAIKPVRQINFFGTSKEVYKIGNILFIDGYTDVFENK